MAYLPDLIIVDREWPEVLAAIELTNADPGERWAASHLLPYMRSTGVALGVVMTPEALTLYEDAFQGGAAESVWCIGRFDLGNTFSTFRGAGTGRAFELAVLSWFDHMDTSGLFALPEETRKALSLHVLPFLRKGHISVSGPRFPSADAASA